MPSRLLPALLAAVLLAAGPAVAQDDEWGDYSLDVVDDGRVLTLSGDFVPGLADDFHALLDASPHVRIVKLESGGGSLWDAMSIAATVAARGLTTYVSGMCASACVVVFAAGHERWIDPGGTLGFHAWTFEDGQEAEARAQQIAIFAAAGFDPSLGERGSEVPSWWMWFPTLEELIAGHAVTHLVAGAAEHRGLAPKDPETPMRVDSPAALAGLPGRIRIEEIRAALFTELPLFSVLEAIHPDEARVIYDNMHARRVAGASFTEMVEAASEELGHLITDARRRADDRTAVELARITLAQVEELDEDHPELCMALVTNTRREAIYAALPTALILREEQIDAALLRSEATAASVSWEEVASRVGDLLVGRVEARLTPGELEAWNAQSPTPDRARDYCGVHKVWLEEVLRLDLAEAAGYMRELWSNQLGD